MARALAPDAYAIVIIHLSQPPGLSFESPIIDDAMEDYITRAFGGDINIIAFVEGLRDFATESDFLAFYEANSDYYEALRSDTLRKLGDTDYMAALEEYVGAKQGEYHIILGPLLHHGGFGPSVVRDKGVTDLLSIIGPVGETGGVPDFGDLTRLQDVLWHEFAHSFVDPITAENLEDVNEFADLYTPIADQMAEAGGYMDWHTTVNEHVIRAITSRLFHHELGPKAGQDALEAEKSLGFEYVEAIHSKLVVYESDRSKYPTIESFYPEIIATFREISAEHD